MMNFNIQTQSMVNIAIQRPKISFQKIIDFQWNSHTTYVSLTTIYYLLLYYLTDRTRSDTRPDGKGFAAKPTQNICLAEF